jgi:hypothetical protein
MFEKLGAASASLGDMLAALSGAGARPQATPQRFELTRKPGIEQRHLIRPS